VAQKPVARHIPRRPLSSWQQVRGHGGSGGCWHPRPRALTLPLWGLSVPVLGCFPRRGVRRVPTALRTTPVTAGAVLIPSTSGTRTAKPLLLLAPLRAP